LIIRSVRNSIDKKYMIDKLNIGVVVNSELSNGGAFSQANAIIDQLINEPTNNYYFITNNHSTYEFLEKRLIKASFLFSGIIRLIKDFVRGRVPALPESINMIAGKYKLDFVYMVGPYDTFLNLTRCGYVFTINDLCHRDRPEFKEVSGIEFDRREKIYGLGSIRALITIVDSECTKNKLINYYGVDQKKIIINEFSLSREFLSHDKLSNIYDVKNNFGEYIYYPAQFWSHKNHRYIVDTVNILIKNGKFNWKVVFTGTDYGNKKFIFDYIKELNLQDYFVDLGFVDEKMKNELYSNSKCVVFPTWFGPTNIPPLEAFFLEIPVIYSMQGNEAGLFSQYTTLVDLLDINSLANAILQIANNSPNIVILKNEAKKYIDKRLNNSPCYPLFEYINVYKAIKKSWG
jgi:glycosyltransferase involved in cell wall biosynthesis